MSSSGVGHMDGCSLMKLPFILMYALHQSDPVPGLKDPITDHGETSGDNGYGEMGVGEIQIMSGRRKEGGRRTETGKQR